MSDKNAKVVKSGSQDFADICAGHGESNLFNDRQPTFTKRVPYRVFAALVLPGGRVLVGGAPDGTIDVIHPETAAVEMTLKGHNDSVMALAISPHGLFSASADREVRRWSLKDFSPQKVFYGHEGMVTAMTVAPVPGNGGLLSGGDDQTIRQWNVESGACIYVFKDHKAAVNCIKSTSQNFFSGDGDGIVHVYDFIKRRVDQKLVAHNAEVWCLAFSEETGTLYTGGGDGHIKVWPDAVTKGVCAAVLTGHRGPVRALVEDEGILFSGGADSLVACWDVSSIDACVVKEVMRMYNEAKTMQCTKSITCMGFANNEVMAVGFDKVINRWDVTDLLEFEHDIIPLPPLDALEEAEMEQKLLQLPPQDRHQYYVELDVSEAIKKYTELPINYIIESLNYKVSSSWLTSELAFYLPFLVMFLFFFLSDYNAMDVFYMNTGIVNLLDEEDIGGFKLPRSYYQITDSTWWATWVTTLFFGQVWAGKGVTPWYEPFRFAGQNQLIGGVRFRTQRVLNTSCNLNLDAFNEALLNTTDWDSCFGRHHGISQQGLDTEPFVCAFPNQTSCRHDPDAMRDVLNLTSGVFEYDYTAGNLYRGLKFYPTGGYTVFIPGGDSCADGAGHG